VQDGEFFCLLGPPGAGKTTTLRIIAGLEKADRGSVFLDEEPVDDVHPSRRDVAMVFEDVALYPHWSGFDNLAHPLKLRKLPREEIEERVHAVAEMLHITHLLGRRPDTYSGGERRRVAIGRALVRRPRVLLLDQPLTDLDARIRQEMTAELKRLQRDTGQTMIYATHDYEEAVAMADRVLVMHEGLAEQMGGPEEVYEEPASAVVAQMIGSPRINLLSCRLEATPDGWILQHPAFSLPVKGLAQRQMESKDVLLGIRPEHLVAEREQTQNSIPATVDIVQPLGHEQIVDLSLQDGTVMKMVAPLAIELVPDDRLYVRFMPERLYLFDAATGRRLTLPQV
jgi:multiple sugar transport system ATP-binding protein